jgi:tRNA nucleotidyltransferase (CCA-adding enzyme)
MTGRLLPPRSIRRIVSVLESAGYEAWCVGGAVRDALLGLEHLDWDIATSARPIEVQRLFRRTVPVGIEFGTVGVLGEDGVLHEVTTFRRDVQTDGRHAVVEFGATLEDDLARRDFTINALAYSPTRNELRDPFDGRADLAKGLIRAVGDPDERMREDRLRALRAIRFAARFCFEIEPVTWEAIVNSAPYLTRLSAERVRQEIEKTLDQVLRPSTAFSRWRDAGAIAVLVPALAGMASGDLEALDCLPVPALRTRPARRSNRLAALFRKIPDRAVGSTLKALRFSNSEAAWISALVDRWQAIAPAMKEALLQLEGPSDSVIRRWIARAGRTRFASVVRIASAEWNALSVRGEEVPSAARVRSMYRRALKIAFRDPVELSDLAIDGNDVRQLGVSGPSVGHVLQGLLDEVLADPTRNTPQRLTELARAIVDRGEKTE